MPLILKVWSANRPTKNIIVLNQEEEFTLKGKSNYLTYFNNKSSFLCKRNLK